MRTRVPARSIFPSTDFYGAKMKNIVTLCLLLVVCGASAAAKTNHPAKHRSNQQILTFILDFEEQRILAVAEAMPEEKYDFAPAGDGFKGVRTFAEQLRHIAADNYMLGSGILGEKPPVELGTGEFGNAAAKTKPEIIRDLRASFAYMRRAAATTDDGNVAIPTPDISPWPAGTATRLGVGIEELVHTWDHYGQLVEYLRMNGIIPPTSRK
jgi:hypothetical protein